MPQQEDQNQGGPQTRTADDDPGMPQPSGRPEGTPSTVTHYGGSSSDDGEGGGATAEAEGDTLPPPSAHRPDTMVRAVSPQARMQMERGGNFSNQASFTKGVNAPTADQARYPYTVEDMDEILSEAPRGLFPDTPGGDGATPLSVDRLAFLATMRDRGNFPSQEEAEKWARAVFNALRQCAIEQDDALAVEFASVVRVGEAPEVQVEEMMWGGDFIDRMSRALSVSCTWPRQKFYEQVAEYHGVSTNDPWVDAAVHSFLGTLKSFLGDDAGRVGNLRDLQEVWDRV